MYERTPLTIHPNGTAMEMADDTVHDSMHDKENTTRPCPAAEASAESETTQLGTEC